LTTTTFTPTVQVCLLSTAVHNFTRPATNLSLLKKPSLFYYSSNNIKIKIQNKISVLCISIYKHASHPIRKLYEVSLASPPSPVIVRRLCRYEKGICRA